MVTSCTGSTTRGSSPTPSSSSVRRSLQPGSSRSGWTVTKGQSESGRPRASLSVPRPDLEPAGSGRQPAAALPARLRLRPAGRWRAVVPRGLGNIALAPLYRLYTHRLRERVRRAPLPHHVAVILDGSRRWATELGLTEPSAGHHRGAAKVDELIGWCAGLGIGEVTVWAL